jgi:hypothetical protein
VTLPTVTSETLTVDWGTRSRTSGNFTCTVIGVVPDVGSTGQRHLLDGEAARTQQDRDDEQEDEPEALHRATSISWANVGSTELPEPKARHAGRSS